MQVDILCSDPKHPVNVALETWVAEQKAKHDVAILRAPAELQGGDILFLVSCSHIITRKKRDMYRHVMVLHASDLPKGRGWSPHVWAILEGAKQISVTLLVAEDGVDSGDIWARERLNIAPGALFDDINASLFDAETKLMSKGIALVMNGQSPVSQSNENATYYRKRSPEDGKLDPTQPLTELFDQIRVADPNRYPAYFELHGETYTLELRKVISLE